MNGLGVAANRFGLGARPGDAKAAGRDPVGWLMEGAKAYEARPQAVTAFDPAAAIAGLRELQQSRAMSATGGADANLAVKVIRPMIRDGYAQAAGVRLALAVESDAPWPERLVHFWSNHFAVSVDKVTVIGLAGPYEFEAIRPHVMGRFEDLLLAAVRHPAMLLYLDQAQSAGPGSQLSQLVARYSRQGRTLGMNENLAREVLELHTLGVDGGYGQADVLALARALTGWSVGGFARGPGQRLLEEGTPGRFQFQPAMHEGSRETLLGRRYGADGVAQAEAMLRDLAVHPSTARHVSFKLARHFVADQPPEAMVAAMAAAWKRTGGDLQAVYRAMLERPEAWEPGAKFRSPWEWLVAALRGLDMAPAPLMLRALSELGQPVWQPGSPAGFPDVAAHWAAPDALLRRVEVAAALAARAPGRDAREIGPVLAGGSLSDATREAVARAEGGEQALALLLVSPEMLRR